MGGGGEGPRAVWGCGARARHLARQPEALRAQADGDADVVVMAARLGASLGDLDLKIRNLRLGHRGSAVRARPAHDVLLEGDWSVGAHAAVAPVVPSSCAARGASDEQGPVTAGDREGGG